MNIIVLANANQQAEILLKATNKRVNIDFAKSFDTVLNQNADAYFVFTEVADIFKLKEFTLKPVFFNSVFYTLKELELPQNISRINGWTGFLQRDCWEVATQNEEMVKEIFKELQWKYLLVKDEPGLISARIISMIVNEAFFALEDDVSTKGEIEIAMKLGTN